MNRIAPFTSHLLATLSVCFIATSCSTEVYQVGQDQEGTSIASCNDGLDNDGDGLSDCDDPDCAGSGEEGVPNSCGPTLGLPDAGPVDYWDVDGSIYPLSDGGGTSIWPDAATTTIWPDAATTIWPDAGPASTWPDAGPASTWPDAGSTDGYADGGYPAPDANI